MPHTCPICRNSCGRTSICGRLNAESHHQQSAKPAGDVVGFRTVVIHEHVVIATITEKRTAEFPHGVCQESPPALPAPGSTRFPYDDACFSRSDREWKQECCSTELSILSHPTRQYIKKVSARNCFIAFSLLRRGHFPRHSGCHSAGTIFIFIRSYKIKTKVPDHIK